MLSWRDRGAGPPQGRRHSHPLPSLSHRTSAWAGAGVCSQGSCSPCSGKSCFPCRRNLIQQAELSMAGCGTVRWCCSSAFGPYSPGHKGLYREPCPGPAGLQLWVLAASSSQRLLLTSGAAPGPLCFAPLRSSLWLPAQPHSLHPQP